MASYFDESKAIGAAKTGAVVGASMGAYSAMMSNGGFVLPALQLGGISGLVSYFAADYDDKYSAVLIGGAAGATCKLIQGFSTGFCLQYAVASGAVSYVAMVYVAPEVSGLYAKAGM